MVLGYPIETRPPLTLFDNPTARYRANLSYWCLGGNERPTRIR